MSVISACRALERGVIWIGALVAWVTLIPLIVVAVYDMIGRQFFHVGSTRLQELEWHFFLAVVMLGLGYAYMRDAHVRIDIMRDRLTLRTRAWIELIGCLLVLVPFCMMLIVHGGEIALNSFVTMERARAPLGLPMRWIIKSTLPMGGLLLLLAGSSVAIRNAMFLAGRTTGPAPASGERQSG
ncbi:MAG: TRAP transporter small permease subunit [Rhodospirillales bacterium]|nr:TRAP transporter small permease subunit [Rhodospirillales bacterium]